MAYVVTGYWVAGYAEAGGATATIALTSPTSNKMHQRNGAGQASVTVAGSATAGGIEYRWAGGSWATLVASHPGGTFSQAVTLSTGQGTLEVRHAADTGVIASAELVTVGDVFLVAGQSNNAGRAAAVVAPVASAFTALEMSRAGAWIPLQEAGSGGGLTTFDQGTGAAGSYFGALSNRLQAQGVPVAFVPCAQGSTGIVDWQRYDPDPTNAYFLYGNQRQRAAAVVDHKAVLFFQGENDAASGMAQAAYEGHLDAYVDDWYADTERQVFVIKICRWIVAADTIRAAQSAVIASNPHVIGSADANVWASGDVHYSTTTEVNAVADAVYAGMVTAFYSSTLSSGSDAIGYADAGGLLAPQLAVLTGGADSLGYVDGGGVAAPGVLGWVILLTTAGGSDGAGFLHNDVLPGDEYKRFTFNITRQPTLGTLTTYPDGTFTYSGLADTFEYEGFADDISYGVAEVAVGTPIAEVTLSGASDAIGYRDAGGAMLPDLIALTGGADALGYIDAGGSAFDPGSTLAEGSDSIGYLDAGGAMFTDLVALSGGADSIGYLDAGTIFYSLTRGRAPTSRTSIFRRA